MNITPISAVSESSGALDGGFMGDDREEHEFSVEAGRLTALVVEDDPRSATLIRVQFEACGFTVLHATTAQAALMLAVQQPLSVITLGVMLPDMNGWEFLARLRQIPALSRVPAAIVSVMSREAIEFARQMLPDLIVLDLIRSGMNGLGVVEALQRSARTTKVLVLAVTPS